MKALLPLIASAWMSVPAHAVTFNCQGAAGAQGVVNLQCDDKSCMADGEVATPSLVEGGMTLHNCGAARRPETNAQMYKNLAYYDVSDKQCWASYIRIAKNFNADGSISASLVNSHGAPVEDYSGYEYVSLNCQVQK